MGAVVKGFLCYSEVKESFPDDNLGQSCKKRKIHNCDKCDTNCVCDCYDVHSLFALSFVLWMIPLPGPPDFTIAIKSLSNTE